MWYGLCLHFHTFSDIATVTVRGSMEYVFCQHFSSILYLNMHFTAIGGSMEYVFCLHLSSTFYFIINLTARDSMESRFCPHFSTTVYGMNLTVLY